MTGARRAVAVFLSRFPLITETFVLREIEEMERQGQPVLLVPLLRERPHVVHREAVAWTQRAIHAPLLSVAVATANLRALRRGPRRYAAAVWRVVRGAAGSAHLLVRTLALLPKSVYLAEQLTREGVGHVHAHFATHPTMAALLASELTGLGYSFTAHAHDIQLHRSGLGEKIRRARFVRVISAFNRDELRRRYPAESAGRLRVIHVGVDLGALPAALPAAAAAPPRILCVAACRPYKGLSVLVAACRALAASGRAFRCDIVGDGPLRPALERQVRRCALAGRVNLLGARRQDEVAGLLAAAAVVVQPSVVAADGQMEGIPVALMEAMAWGRPVVASALSGIPELVEDSVSGLLVPPGDAGALAAAIVRLLDDPALARRLGEAARAKVEREFRLDASVAALLDEIDRHNVALPAELEAALAASTWPALAGRRLGVRRLHQGPDSFVADLLVAGPEVPRAAIFKLHRTHAAASRPAADSARREFEVLRRLEPAFAGDLHLGVPRALHLDEATAALVMDRCPGRPLDAVVGEARAALDAHLRAACETAVHRCGQWLRRFQRHTTSPQDAGILRGRVVESALDDLAVCTGRAVPASEAPRIAARLRELAGRDTQDRRIVGHHGDFWPGNVFVDGDRVQVIDFEGYREGLPYEDAAYFLAQLGRFYSYPVLRSRLPALRSAFLDGFLAGDPVDEQQFELCRVAGRLQILARSVVHPMRGRRAPSGRRAVDWVLRGALT